MAKEEPSKSEQEIDISSTSLSNSQIAQAKGDVVQGSYNSFDKKVINIFVGSSSSEQNLNRTEAENFLIREVQTEIKSRIKHSLHREIAITLGKEMQLHQVRTWSASVKVGMNLSH